MRIAASDYDGTLATWQGLIGDVVPAVARWRAAGNIFGIATGRDLPMILTETEKYGIGYDFLVCMNGAVVYDGDPAHTLLSSTLLPDDLHADLMRHPAGRASMHFQLSCLDELCVLLREGSWFPMLGIRYREVDFDEGLALRGLGQVSLAYKTVEECARWHAMLLRDFDGRITAHHNKTTIDINPFGVDKATGIEDVIRRKGWGGCGTPLVIGDGGNDIGMIKRFGGYTVPGADEAVLRAATRVFESVPAMLEHFTP